MFTDADTSPSVRDRKDWRASNTRLQSATNGNTTFVYNAAVLISQRSGRHDAGQQSGYRLSEVWHIAGMLGRVVEL